MDVSTSSFSHVKIIHQNNWKFVKLWIIAVCIYILLFLFVCDLYFKSPIHHGLEAHSGTPYTKRVVLFVVDGLRQETLSKHASVTEYLRELRDEEKCAQGVVHTRVPTESRPGHAAILGGIYEDPSAVFSGWKSNLVEFDSVVNRSNYAWLFGSPDIVNSYGKTDNWKLQVESYTPEYQDFSGKGNVSDLDKWVFDRAKHSLHNRAGSCEEEFFKLRRFQRKINFQNYKPNKRKCKGLDKFIGKPYCNYQYVIRWTTDPILDRFDAKIREVKYECAVEEVKNCGGVICESGNLFFLHLLGMDSAGHIHKPNSEKFIDTLRELDIGIEGMVMLFEDFFNDEETTFILTSDHGMTDWGAHGDGSEMETDVPLMIWGKGVKPSNMVLHLEQIDIAPLISILLGIPIPINSVGFIDYRILNGSKQEVNKALLVNLEQLVENYNYLRNGYDRDYFFRDPRFFKSRDPSEFVEMFRSEIYKNQSLDENVLIIKNVADEVLKSIKYLNDYYFTPKMGMVWYSFILWNIYLIMSLHPRKDPINRVWLETFHSCRSCFYMLIGIIVAIFSGYAYCLQSSYFSYMYIAFPTITTIHFFMNDRVIYDIYKFNQRRGKGVLLLRALWLILLIQILVFGFFDNRLYGFILGVMVFWMNNFKPTIGILKFFWFVINASLTVCLLIPHSTLFSFEKFYIGISVWIVFNVITSAIVARRAKYCALSVILLTSFPCFLLLATSVNTYIVAKEFEDEGISEQTRWISWILTSISLMSIPFYPNNLLIKFNHLCFALSIPYILTSTNSDLITYTILVMWLNLWIILESNTTDIHSEYYTTKLNIEDSTMTYDNHRRSFFYVAITMTYFFAIGNLASFSGFDPLWTRAYVSTFRKNLMASLIIMKMTTPFFLITCAYSAINTVQRVNVLATFTITMIQLNQMILNFMLNIKNEGSWKEIGQSLSHFIVVEVMALMLLSFYLLSLYITEFSLCSEIEHDLTISRVSEKEMEMQTFNLENPVVIKQRDQTTNSIMVTDEGTNATDKLIEAEQDEKIIIISSKLRSYPPKYDKVSPSYLRHRLLSVIKDPDVMSVNYRTTESNDLKSSLSKTNENQKRNQPKKSSKTTETFSNVFEYERKSPSCLKIFENNSDAVSKQIPECLSRKTPEHLSKRFFGNERSGSSEHSPRTPERILKEHSTTKSNKKLPRNLTEYKQSKALKDISPERLPRNPLEGFPEQNNIFLSKTKRKSPELFSAKQFQSNQTKLGKIVTTTNLENSTSNCPKFKSESDVFQRKSPAQDDIEDENLDNYLNFAKEKVLHASSSGYEGGESSTDEKIKRPIGLQIKVNVDNVVDKHNCKKEKVRAGGKRKHPIRIQTKVNANKSMRITTKFKDVNPNEASNSYSYINHDLSEDCDENEHFSTDYQTNRINEDFSANYPDIISEPTIKTNRNLKSDCASNNFATQTNSIYFDVNEERDPSTSLENRTSRDRNTILKQFDDLFSNVSEESIDQNYGE